MATPLTPDAKRPTMARRTVEPSCRVTKIVTVPDPDGKRWNAAIAMLLEAANRPDEESA